jgi:hypothetical protein
MGNYLGAQQSIQHYHTLAAEGQLQDLNPHIAAQRMVANYQDTHHHHRSFLRCLRGHNHLQIHPGDKPYLHLPMSEASPHLQRYREKNREKYLRLHWVVTASSCWGMHLGTQKLILPIHKILR